MICFRPSTLFIVLVVLVSSATSHAQSSDSRARQHISEGERLFERGEYAKAIEELTAGNVLNPQARVYYALGQAYRMNHQCGEAVKAYRSFLDLSPAPVQRRATERWIQRCNEEDPQSTVEPVPAPVVTPAVTPSAAQPAVVPGTTTIIGHADTQPGPVAKTPVYKKWWLWTAVGVVAVGVGVGLGVGLTVHSSTKFDQTIPGFGPAAPAATLLRINFR